MRTARTPAHLQFNQGRTELQVAQVAHPRAQSLVLQSGHLPCTEEHPDGRSFDATRPQEDGYDQAAVEDAAARPVWKQHRRRDAGQATSGQTPAGATGQVRVRVPPRWSGSSVS